MQVVAQRLAEVKRLYEEGSAKEAKKRKEDIEIFKQANEKHAAEVEKLRERLIEQEKEKAVNSLEFCVSLFLFVRSVGLVVIKKCIHKSSYSLRLFP